MKNIFYLLVSWLTTVLAIHSKYFSTIASGGWGIYEYETKVTSLTRSENIFGYIECKNPMPTPCRDFTCFAFSKSSPVIQWYFKDYTDKERDYELISSENYAQQGLMTNSSVSLDKRKYGHLQCVAKTSNREEKIEREVVPYNNSGQVFIKLQELNVAYNASESKRHVDVHWRIYVQGRPNLTLLANNEIINESSVKYEYNITVNEIYLKIKNVSEEDLYTKFRVNATSLFDSATLELTLNITDKPDVAIDVDFLNSTTAIISCQSISISKQDISWSFSPCLENNCTSEELNPIDVKRNSSILTSTITVHATMSGYVVCHSNNSFGRSYKVQQIDDMNGSIDIIGPKNMKELDELTKIVRVDYFESVVVTCLVSAFNHTNNITWSIGDLNTSVNDSTDVWSTVFTYRRSCRLDRSRGPYFCHSWDQNGIMEYKKVQVDYERFSSPYLAVVFLAVALVVISLVGGVKFRDYWKLQKEMNELNDLGLANFGKGAVEHLNPDLTIDGQADLLPYDEAYEFPVEQLTLKERIGSGAFGVVMKAEAKNIFEMGQSTTVAVKVVNRNADNIYIKALTSELKIMIHLGKHINIVNLLGACTKKISKRELLVITEYCRFGNLRDYLLIARNTFINQINADTCRIDFNTGSDILGSDISDFLYITPSFTNLQYCSDATHMIQTDTAANEGVQYKLDDRNVNKPVSTRDLLIWSFQIARGMEYLAFRKVIHGDLAARNILLTDGNVVKICDFGLSKNMYYNNIYKKSGDEMLPVKWTAIEALIDKVFSVESDVWSFGIVLWEIFSLGKIPYPGMEYNEGFIEKLLNGYRMKVPDYANDEIYDIMRHCWETEPKQRPSFTDLVTKIGLILGDAIREHYIDMNIGYVKMNSHRFGQRDVDYLMMVGAPKFEKYSSSHNYVNTTKTITQDGEKDKDEDGCV